MDVPTYNSLDGQVALVTGATRGIGARIADELAALDATVYAGARDTDDVDGDGLRPIGLDVTDEREMIDAIDRIDREADRLDVLVNNAGVMDTRDPLDRMPTDSIDRTLDTNLRGPILLTKHAASLLLDREGSRVVNVSTGMSRFERMSSGSPAYRVSKVGLNGLSAYLDAEYGDRGLIANAVSPGWVRTDMGGESAPRSIEAGADTPVWLCRFRPGGPGGYLWQDREPIEW
jgi:hypothetical protein